MRKKPTSKQKPRSEVRRGQYIGKRVGTQPKDEAEHFMRCPDCRGLVDMRDLGQVLEHHGPLPHPKQDQTQ
jgi:hypothetical protein